MQARPIRNILLDFAKIGPKDLKARGLVFADEIVDYCKQVLKVIELKEPGSGSDRLMDTLLHLMPDDISIDDLRLIKNNIQILIPTLSNEQQYYVIGLLEQIKIKISQALEKNPPKELDQIAIFKDKLDEYSNEFKLKINTSDKDTYETLLEKYENALMKMQALIKKGIISKDKYIGFLHSKSELEDLVHWTRSKDIVAEVEYKEYSKEFLGRQIIDRIVSNQKNLDQAGLEILTEEQRRFYAENKSFVDILWRQEKIQRMVHQLSSSEEFVLLRDAQGHEIKDVESYLALNEKLQEHKPEFKSTFLSLIGDNLLTPTENSIFNKYSPEEKQIFIEHLDTIREEAAKKYVKDYKRWEAKNDAEAFVNRYLELQHTINSESKGSISENRARIELLNLVNAYMKKSGMVKSPSTQTIQSRCDEALEHISKAHPRIVEGLKDRFRKEKDPQKKETSRRTLEKMGAIDLGSKMKQILTFPIQLKKSIFGDFSFGRSQDSVWITKTAESLLQVSIGIFQSVNLNDLPLGRASPSFKKHQALYDEFIYQIRLDILASINSSKDSPPKKPSELRKIKGQLDLKINRYFKLAEECLKLGDISSARGIYTALLGEVDGLYKAYLNESEYNRFGIRLKELDKHILEAQVSPHVKVPLVHLILTKQDSVNNMSSNPTII